MLRPHVIIQASPWNHTLLTTLSVSSSILLCSMPLAGMQSDVPLAGMQSDCLWLAYSLTRLELACSLT